MPLNFLNEWYTRRLRSKNWSVRTSAARALGRRHCYEAADALYTSLEEAPLNDYSAAGHIAAVQALLRLGDPRGLEWLRENIKSLRERIKAVPRTVDVDRGWWDYSYSHTVWIEAIQPEENPELGTLEDRLRGMENAFRELQQSAIAGAGCALTE